MTNDEKPIDFLNPHGHKVVLESATGAPFPWKLVDDKIGFVLRVRVSETRLNVVRYGYRSEAIRDALADLNDIKLRARALASLEAHSSAVQAQAEQEVDESERRASVRERLERET